MENSSTKFSICREVEADTRSAWDDSNYLRKRKSPQDARDSTDENAKKIFAEDAKKDAVTCSKPMKYIIDELSRASSVTCCQSYENVIETAFCDFPSLCCFPGLFHFFDLPVYTIKPKSKTEISSAMAKVFVFEFKTKYYSS